MILFKYYLFKYLWSSDFIGIPSRLRKIPSVGYRDCPTGLTKNVNRPSSTMQRLKTTTQELCKTGRLKTRWDLGHRLFCRVGASRQESAGTPDRRGWDKKRFESPHSKYKAAWSARSEVLCEHLRLKKRPFGRQLCWYRTRRPQTPGKGTSDQPSLGHLNLFHGKRVQLYCHSKCLLN